MNSNKPIPYSVQWERRVSFKKGIPWIRKQKIDLHDKKFVLINEASKIPLEERENYILLFFADDKFFNAIYSDFNQERLAFLQSFYAVCGLDFSTYPDADSDENRAAIKKNRRFCTFCQQHDILCIYNIVWSSPDDYDLAFSNIEEGAIVIVSTYRISESDSTLFREGYEEFRKRSNPGQILCYGKPQPCMAQDSKQGIIKAIPTRFEIVKQEEFEHSGQRSFIDLLMTA